MTGFWNSTKISCLSSQRNSNGFMQHVSTHISTGELVLQGGSRLKRRLLQLFNWKVGKVDKGACGCHNSRAFSNIVMMFDFRKWACGMWGSLSGVVAPGAAD